MRDLITYAYDREYIREKVNDFIDFSVDPNENYVDVYKILKEYLPRKYPGLEIIIVPDDQMKTDAKINVDEKKIWIKKSIDYKASLGYPRERFTIAHEIGHLELGHCLKTLARNGSVSSKLELSIEQIANLYAAELLIPYQKAIKFDTIEDIKLEFGVSMETARIYLVNRDGLAKHKKLTNSPANMKQMKNAQKFTKKSFENSLHNRKLTSNRKIQQATIFD